MNHPLLHWWFGRACAPSHAAKQLAEIRAEVDRLKVENVKAALKGRM